jgi:hypothetical protein
MFYGQDAAVPPAATWLMSRMSRSQDPGTMVAEVKVDPDLGQDRTTPPLLILRLHWTTG